MVSVPYIGIDKKTVILETCWPSQKVESSNICDKDKLRRGGAAALLFFQRDIYHLRYSLSSLFLEIIAWKWFPVKDVTKKIRRLCLLTFTTNDALSPPIVRSLFSESYILPSYALVGVALVNWSCALFGQSAKPIANWPMVKYVEEAKL